MRGGFCQVFPGVVLGVALVGGLVSVDAGKIYWCDRNVGKVQRANLDGSELETLIEVNSTNLRGIAVDIPDGKLYFADNAADTISRANLDGSGVTVLVTDRGFPADVDLDLVNRKLYWCDQQRGVIERSNLDGSQLETVVATPSPYYLDLDLPGQRLFWGDFAAGNIHYVGLDDSGAAPVNVVTGQPRIRGVKLDLDRGEVVWCNRQSNHVQRRTLAGGPLQTVITDLDTPHGLAIDPVARKAYWCDTGTDGHNQGGRTISRTDLDVGGPLETVAALSQPWDADIDYMTSSYEQYVARYFRIGRTEEETETGGDFDEDGFTQLLEYGTASHPERQDLVPAYGIQENDEGWFFHYQRFHGVTDLDYRLEVSDDMDVWVDNAFDGNERVEAKDFGVEGVEVPLSENVAYVRLRVTLKE